MKAQEGCEHYYNNIADDAEEALQHNVMKPIYKAVRHISNKQSVGQVIFPRKADGQMCNVLAERRRPQQSGFTAVRSTADAILALPAVRLTP